MRRIELLSPAGGMEALRAAVQNGADAVYLGEKSFSARQNAENFDKENLCDAVKYAHQRGVKVYIAMNTLVSYREIKDFVKGVENAARSGADALIIQDFGAAEAARRVCPKMPIHASTQMSAHNEKDVEYLLKRGFSRIVLARELKKSEIEKIYTNTNASLEVFVHGALCVCASGQCLMSSFIGGRSGNRGRCAQPCRQMYSAEGKNGYWLSPRDLCLLDEISDLYETGVDSLKIEGRMKNPEYVASVTGMYRKYLDEPKKAKPEDIKELEKIFVRGDGFTKAYFAGVNTPQMMNYSLSNDGISYKGDKEALKRSALTFRDGVENKKTGVFAYLTIHENMPVSLVMSDGTLSATSEGKLPEPAVSLPMDKDKAESLVGKLGQTPFYLEHFECSLDDKLTVSAKDINALRRECANQLLELRGEPLKYELMPFGYDYTNRKREKAKIAVSVLTDEQLKGADGADYIYMPIDVFEKSEKKENYAVVLPKVTYDIDKYIERLKSSGAKKILASTYGTAKELMRSGFECIGDYGLNIYNPISANEYKNEGIKHITLSPELSCDDIRGITSNTDAVCEVLAYGRMMMMTSRACIIKGVRKKCSCDKPLVLRDKTGAEFLVYADKNEHINMIYNTAVTFMADKPQIIDTLGADVIRLVFTDEDKERVGEVISMYKGKTKAVLPKAFTRGYFSQARKNK